MPIKLKDHIVSFEGKDYIPVEVATAAVLEAIGAREGLENAFNTIKNSIDSIETDD